MATERTAAAMNALSDTLLEHHRVSTNGVTLHVVAAGPEDGELIVLLHGFPEFWYGWRKQIPDLAAAGYRVVVPDQRGYNQSDKPEGIASYTLDKLCGDIDGLIRHFGREDASIIGHDWGAVVAWGMGMLHRQRVRKLGILNVPHPVVFDRTIRGNLRQLMRSWYVLFFQISYLPEAILSGGAFDVMANQLRSSSRPGTFTDEDLALYREAWARRDALSSMVNWYRAIVQRARPAISNVRLPMPVHIIWGAQDKFLGVEMARESVELCDDGELTIIDEATHWVQHEEPDRVNSLLLEFLAKE